MKCQSKIVRSALCTAAVLTVAASATGANAAKNNYTKGTYSTADSAASTTEPTPTPAPAPAPPPVVVTNPVLFPLAGNIRTFGGDLNGTAGNIRTFAGDGTVSAGNIRTFAGNIRTFAGNIRAFQSVTVTPLTENTSFWGTLTPASGVIAPSAGNIRTFGGTVDGLAGNIRTFADGLRSADGKLLTYNSAPAVYIGLGQQITTLVAASKATWGAAVQAQSGRTFENAFVKPMLAKYGIDLSKPSTLAGLNEVGLELFLLDWNDNLMNYSGRDQVDHWMKTINWSPALSQQVTGGGMGSKIGLLDFTVFGLQTGAIVTANGISTVAGGHGTAVASLIFAPHDGKNVMGIAPRTSVYAYNPFDSTMTAGWKDIQTGINSFVDVGVSVVNISLGVPGWTLNEGWSTVFAPGTLDNAISKQLFVFAAGNDGAVQPGNINWDVDKSMAFIVVGSVDPSGKISAFSNTPGTTCLMRAGKCETTPDLLMNHFIVAPGEFMLVADENGGVTRMSGTSFAAPLVSGTAALIADRWPWLALFYNDIADTILKSATDLGAPGVDPIYGNGLLNVEAALSPLSLDALEWKVTVDGKITTYSATTIASAATANKAAWELNGGYVTIYEKTARSFRDFKIPLSSKLIGQTVGLGKEQFQAYLQSRFWTWVESQANKVAGLAFTDNNVVTPLAGFGDLNAAVTLRPRTYRPGLRQSDAPFDTGLSFRVPGSRIAFRVGSGNGAALLSEQSGFQLASDYDVNTGGANPFLALASGGGYASVDVALNDRLSFSTGVTSHRAERDLDLVAPEERQALARLMPYRAAANTVAVRYEAADWLSANVSYTMLREKSGLLGVQSLDQSDFGNGTTTDAGTYGLDIALTPTLSVAGSATIGRTRAGDKTQQNIVVSRGGLMSTSFQLAIAKSKLFGQKDSARITFSQPLHVERGSVDFNSVEVIDRQTGELGVVTQTIGLQSPKRSYVAEAIYRRPIMSSGAEVSLFGRARLGGDLRSDQESALTMGAAFRVRF